jgi:uncharacterized protein (DUF305 family)
MNEHQQNEMSFIHKIIIPFLVYTAMFLGAGFISGAVVHFPVAPTRNLIIGGIGAILFAIGATVNESIFNKKNLRDEGVVKFVLFSLLLSFGIGMVSGGSQHFFDTPEYASYLIPAGLLIGLVAFILQRNIHFTKAVITGLAVVAVLIIAPLGLALNYATKQLPTTTVDDHHEESSNMMGNTNKRMMGGLENDSQMMSMMQGMDHGAMVNSDADFIMEMIPHHQEAIDTSEYMLSRTEDEEFRKFLQGIIDAQKREVAMMQQWHQQWFNEPYQDDGRYKKMMPDLEKISDYDQVRQQYLMGMIMHHMGAVQMAAKIKTITQRTEVKDFADDIIRVQNQEIEQMREWMMESSQSSGGGMMDHMGH